MKLFNTLTRSTDDIIPIDNKNKTIKLYACGLTVYSQPHIGNWVAYIYWDVLVRTLRAGGYTVEHVQNITDVGHLTSDEDAGEDKMLKGALKEGKTAWEVAEKYIEIAEHEAYDLLGLTRPTHMPRATNYIPQQIAFVEELARRGYTYQTEDGIYFDTHKFPNYGKLARLDIDGLQFGARVESTGKKNPTDFAVWKFSPEGQKRDMEWDNPCGIAGKGFPGWHLECSVMARESLGDQIDIHTGGIDHIPVHHTNEIAQTESVTEKQFSRFWVHANHIKVNGIKMSKSLGNVYTLQDILDKGYDLDAFRLLVLNKHYRTEGNFTWDIMQNMQNVLDKFNDWAYLQFQSFESSALATNYQEALSIIEKTLFEDLDTHEALGCLNGMVDRIEDLGIDSKAIEEATQSLHALLGLRLAPKGDITSHQKVLIQDREQARANKDWAKSDVLRDELLAQGIEVKDTPNGTLWSRI